MLTAVLVSCAATPVYDPVATTPSRTFDFESGTFQGIGIDQVPRPEAGLLQSNVALGSWAVKITVRPEDRVANGNRSELSVFDCAPYGATVFYRFSFLIPEGDPDAFDWQILSQIYQLPDWKHGETFDFFFQHPPVVLTYVPGFLQVQLNAGGPETTVAKTRVTKGVWHTVVQEIRLADDPTGYVEVRLDGVPITPKNGDRWRVSRATLHNKAGAYWKTGLYRGHPGTDSGQAKSTNVVYLDEIRVGSSLSEVSP